MIKEGIFPELQGVLWSRKLKNLDLDRDKNYIIHQILAYGNIEQLAWLFKNYSREEVIEVFLSSPKKVYSPASLNFVKNYLLPLTRKKLGFNRYAKAIR